jgi:hypothetical protein
MPDRVLVLHVKKEYFDQIKSGEKTEEYRIVKPYWWKRLHGVPYDHLVIMWGYPKFSEMCADNCLDFPYRGYNILSIKHHEFGSNPVLVFAITLQKEE